MEASVVPLLRNFSTAKVLVSAINKQHGPTTSSRNSPNSAQQQQRPLAVSIYIQDQVAAVLANMAANVDCRAEVVKHGGLPLLLQFLLAEPAPATATSTDLKAEDYAQLAATERVLQKSAIAISRYVHILFPFHVFYAPYILRRPQNFVKYPPYTYLTVCTVVKFKVEISQNFVVFSEYMNFIKCACFKCSSRSLRMTVA